MTPPLPAAPAVSVVIPARNAAAGLRESMASIQHQSYRSIIEIAVAVGPSDDDTELIAKELAASDERIVVVPNPSGRTPDGLNAAINATSGDVVVRVDAHAVLPAGYVADAVETMQTTGAANVGGVQHAVGDSPFRRALAAAVTSRFGVGNAQYRYATGSPVEVDTAYLGVFRRDALDATGGYDEAFTRNQDYELNVRLRKDGGSVWLDPRLVVDYRPRGSFSELARQYWQYGWWRFRTIAKHPDSLRVRQLIAPALVIGLVASALAFTTGRRRLAALVPLVYSAGVAAAAAITPGELSPGERARLLAIYPTLHLSWGSGLLASVLRWTFGRGDTP